MTIIVELPDGREVEFPDGTPREEMQRAMQAYVAQGQPPAADVEENPLTPLAPPGETTALGMAGNFAEGANGALARLNPISAAIDLVNASPMLLNLLPGDQGIGPISDNPVGGGQAIVDAMREYGFIGNFEPDTRAERISRRVGEEFGASAIPVAGATSRGARLAAEGVAPAQMGMLDRAFVARAQTNPVANAVEEAVIATGAGTGAQIAKEEFAGSPSMEAIGGIGGGMGTAALVNQVENAGRLARQALPGATQAAANEEVGRRLVEAANDPAALSPGNAARAVEDAPMGIQPTVSQATGDLGLEALEAGRRGGAGSGKFAKRGAEQNAVIQEATDAIAPPGQGDDVARRIMADAEAQVQKEFEDARASALAQARRKAAQAMMDQEAAEVAEEAARAQADPGVTRETSSRAAADRVLGDAEDSAINRYKGPRNDLYAQVPEDVRVPTENARAQAENLASQTGRVGRVPPEIRAVMGADGADAAQPKLDMAARSAEAAVKRQPKKPVTRWLSEMKIDPESELADELRAEGISGMDGRGLFKEGGLRDVDNIPMDQAPDEIREILKAADDGLYFDRNDIIDALVGERSGSPRRTVGQQQEASAASDLARQQSEPAGKGTITLAQAKDDLTALGDAAAAAEREGKANLARKLRSMQDAIRGDMETAGEGVEELARANKYEREEYAPRFREGAAADVKRGKLPENRYLDRVFADPNEADRFLKTVGEDDAAMAAARDYMLGDLTRGGADRLTARSVDTWLKRHEEVLGRFPEVRKEVEGIRDGLKAGGSRTKAARENLKAAEREIADVEKLVPPSRDKAIEMYLDRDTARDSVGAIMRSPQSTKMLARLMNLTEGSKEAQDAIRRGAVEFMQRKVRGASQDVSGGFLTRPKAFRDFLDDHGRDLKVLFRRNPEHLDKLTEIADTLTKVNDLASQAPLSKTNRRGDRITLGGVPLNSVISRIFAAESGRTSYRFATSEFLAQVIVNVRNKVNGPLIDNLLDEALLNPKLAASLAQTYNRANDRRAAKAIGAIISRAAARGARSAATSGGDETEE